MARKPKVTRTIKVMHCVCYVLFEMPSPRRIKVEVDIPCRMYHYGGYGNEGHITAIVKVLTKSNPKVFSGITEKSIRLISREQQDKEYAMDILDFMLQANTNTVSIISKSDN